jgi:hypothetical protein
MSSIKLPPVTTGSGEYVERLVDVIAAAFAGDALNRAIILHSDSLPNDAEISHERRVEHFLRSTKSKVSSGGILVEAGNWAAAALWFVVHPRLETFPILMNDLFIVRFILTIREGFHLDWKGPCLLCLPVRH